MDMLHGNLDKVVQHGKRADSIVKNMLLHSRTGPSARQSANVNALADEALHLAYHGARAENPDLNVSLKSNLDSSIGQIDCFPQDLMRVFLNLISNAIYASRARALQEGDAFTPEVSLTSREAVNGVEIEIRDNGSGIPTEIRERIFLPFFTTKPAGEGMVVKPSYLIISLRILLAISIAL